MWFFGRRSDEARPQQISLFDVFKSGRCSDFSHGPLAGTGKFSVLVAGPREPPREKHKDQRERLTAHVMHTNNRMNEFYA